MPQPTPDEAVELEALVDRCGLDKVVTALAEICWGKAEHLRSNWQDRATARLWDQAGKRLDSAATKVSDLLG